MNSSLKTRITNLIKRTLGCADVDTSIEKPPVDVIARDTEVENLEPRMLFSAAPVEAPAPEAEVDPAAEAADAQLGAAATDTESPNAPATTETPAAPDAPEAIGDSEIAEDQEVTLVNINEQSAQLNLETTESAENQAEGRKEIAFVSSDVSDHETLVAGLDPDLEIHVLDGTGNGVEQMAAILRGQTGIGAIHLYTHGEAGALDLGTATLDASTMTGIYADELAVIREALSESADFLIYGCNFAAGDLGAAAAQELADLLEADVAASIDHSGSADRGADWVLEAEFGDVETESIEAAGWRGILVDSDGDNIDDSVDVDDDNDGILDIDENPGAAVGNSNSGTGAFRNEIYWVNWGSDFADGFDSNDTQTFTLSDGSQITLTVTAANADAGSYHRSDMATWFGALLDDLYNTPASFEAMYADNPGLSPVVTFSLSAVDVNGNAFRPDLIFADVETTDTGETNGLTTNGSFWREIESSGSGVLTSGVGTSTVTFSNTQTGMKLFRSDGVSEITWRATPTLFGLGSQALALGFVRPTDTDGDGRPDYLDIDSDDDGITDNVEAQSTEDYIAPSGTGSGITDANNDGLDDRYDSTQAGVGQNAAGTYTHAGTGLTPVNTDGSADNPDYLDSDSDDDGISDSDEAGHGFSQAAIDGSGDADNDGLKDVVDANSGFDVNDDDLDVTDTNFNLADSDNDTNADGSNAAPMGRDLDYRDDRDDTDTDGDTVPDRIDIDDDNDGILDVDEGLGTGERTLAEQSFEVADLVPGGNFVGIDGDLWRNFAQFTGGWSTVNSVDWSEGQLIQGSLGSSASEYPAEIMESPAGGGFGIFSVPDEAVQYSIPTVIGQEYTVSFYVGTLPAYNRQSLGGAQLVYEPGVDWGIISGGTLPGGAPASFDETDFPNQYTAADFPAAIVDPATNGGVHTVLDPHWQEVQLTFVATDTTAVLELLQTSSTSFTRSVTVVDQIRVFEMPADLGIDSDGDGIEDHLDIDSDNDGITDNVEAQRTQDYIAPSGTGAGITDANNDGLDDNYDPGALGSVGGIGLTPVNTDGAADNPDYLDSDSDDDGTNDTDEAGHGVSQATIDASGDADNDGLKDVVDANNGFDVNDDDLDVTDTNFNLAAAPALLPDGSNAVPLVTDLDFRDVPEPPDATDDTYTVVPGTVENIDPRTNDSDPEGDPLTITSITDPANPGAPIALVVGNPETLTTGTIVELQPDGTLNVTQSPNVTVVETFQYEVSDGNGGSDTATVTLLTDSDGDGVANIEDIDDDNDGILDDDEVIRDEATDFSSLVDVTLANIETAGATSSSFPVGGLTVDLTTAGITHGNPDVAPSVIVMASNTHSNSGLVTLDFSQPVNRFELDLFAMDLVNGEQLSGFSIPPVLVIGPDLVFDGTTLSTTVDDVGGTLVWESAVPISQIQFSFDRSGPGGIGISRMETHRYLDSDTDGFSDHRDIDKDDDGITDNVEAQATADYIVPSGVGAGITDTNNDGLDDNYDNTTAAGIAAGAVGVGLTEVNTDGVDQVDSLDSDSDNDSQSDTDEAGHGVSQAAIDASGDADNDGLKDVVEGGDTNDGFDVNDENLDATDTNFNLAAAPALLPDGSNAVPLVTDLNFRDVPEPPDATDDTYAVVPGTVENIDPRTNDSDPEGDPLTITSITDPANPGTPIALVVGNPETLTTGTVVELQPDGTLNVTQSPSMETFEEFTYEVSDGNGGTDTAVVTLLADTDGDGVENLVDVDDDNDGILDVDECGIDAIDSFASETSITTTGDRETFTASGGTEVNVFVSSPTNAQDNRFTFGGITGYWIGDPIGGDDDEEISFHFDHPVTEVKIYATAHTHTGPAFFGNEQMLLEVNGQPHVFDPANFVVTLEDPTITPDGMAILGSTGDQVNLSGGDGRFNYTVSLPEGITSIRLIHDQLTPASGGTIYDVRISGDVHDCIDSDGDGFADHLDIDADDDGITDSVEAQTTAGYIAPSGVGAGITDTNGDGLDDNYDASTVAGAASGATGYGLTPVNTDGAADNPDYLDSDSDDDGTSDADEAGHGFSQTDIDNSGDADNDGLKDVVDANNGFDVNDDDLDATDANFNLAAAPALLPDGSNAVPLVTDLDFRDVPEPPDAIDDNYTVVPGTTTNVDPRTNDTDPEGDPLTITTITDPVNPGTPITLVTGSPETLTTGTIVELQPDGTLNVTQPAGSSLVETFDYTISDGSGGTDTATVTLRSDTDGDGVANAVDIDDDNDGVIDDYEVVKHETTDFSSLPDIFPSDTTAAQPTTTVNVGGITVDITTGGLAHGDAFGRGILGFLAEPPSNSGVITFDFSAPVNHVELDLLAFDEVILEYLTNFNITPTIVSNNLALSEGELRPIGNEAGGTLIFESDTPFSQIQFTAAADIAFGGFIATRIEAHQFIDSDGDTRFDHRDIDKDDDGITDNVEAQTTDGYLLPSGTGAAMADADGDGLDDNYLIPTGAVTNGDFSGDPFAAGGGWTKDETDGLVPWDNVAERIVFDDDDLGDGGEATAQFATVPGGVYRLTYEVGAIGAGPAGLSGLRAFVEDGATTTTLAFEETMLQAGDGPETVTIDFTAVSATTSLSLSTVVDAVGIDVWADNVSLTRLGITETDTDGDDTVDTLDANSDGDGFLDIAERGDGQPTSVTSTADRDFDGLLDIFEASDDNDGFDVNDENLTGANFNLADSDSDTAPDGSGAVPLTADLDYRDVNLPPDAVDDNYGAGEDDAAAVVGNAITDNDTDPENDPLTATPQTNVSGSGGGLFSIDASGQVTFDPAGDFEDLADGATRTTSFTYTINDGAGGTDTATVTVTVTGVNDDPVLDFDADDSSGATGADHDATFSAGGPAVAVIDSDVSITDPDNATMEAVGMIGSFNGIVDVGNEIFSIGGEAFVIGTGKTVNVTAGPGSTVFQVESDGSDLQFTVVSGPATIADFEALLATMTYENTSATLTAGDRTFTLVVHDPDGGVSNQATSTVTVATNVPPAIDLDGNDDSGATGAGYETTFTEGGPAVSIADTDLVITDVDDTNIESATIVLTNAMADDVLAAGIFLPGGIGSGVDTSVPGQITVTLTGTATLAEYEIAIQTITFENTSDTPDLTDRIINVTLNDGDADSNTAVTTVHVIPTDETITIGDVTEREDGTLVFTATLNGGVTSGFTVNVNTTAGGAAGGGVDYTDVVNQTLTFAGNAGETRTFTVTPNDDSLIENPENFTVALSNSSSGEVDLSGATATGTILDNDARPDPPAPGSGVTTDVELVTNAGGGVDLVIEDVETESAQGFASRVDDADSFDQLLIRRVGDNYVITDTGGLALGSPIIGASRNGLSEIIVPVSMVTGDIVVRMGINDDVVTVGPLGSTLTGGLFVDAEDLANRYNDFDVIHYGSDSELAAGGDSEFRAETINGLADSRLEATGDGSVRWDAGRNIFMDVGASVISESGDITYEANLDGQFTGNFSAVHLKGADIESDTGNVDIDGRAGATGNHNRGVFLDVDLTTATGSTIRTGGQVTIDGTGGGGGLYGSGVAIHAGTVASTGNGPVSITGTGGDGTMFNEGVTVQKNSKIDAGTGDLALVGFGGSVGNFNRGLNVAVSSLRSDGGDISADGTGGGAGFYNMGAQFTMTEISTTGSGAITLRGTGAGGTLGNAGVTIATDSMVSNEGGAILVEGTGDGSTLSNHGVQVASGSQIAASGAGAITLTGTGGAGTTQNVGVEISHAVVSVNDGDLTVGGSSLGTLTNNRGVNVAYSILSSSGTADIEVSGIGSNAATGSQNTGIYFDKATVTASGSGKVTLSGTGGSGSIGNDGLILATASKVTLASGDLRLSGSGGGSGSSSMGVGIKAASVVTVGGGGSATIEGTGADGTMLNTGVLLANASQVLVADGDLSVTGTGRGSTSLNDGIKIAGAMLQATGAGQIALDGTGSQTGNGTLNVGFHMVGGSVATAEGSLTIGGQGGTGTSLNQGIRAVGGTVSSNSGGKITMTGVAAAGTTGVCNMGIYLLGMTFDSKGEIVLEGTGGGGTLLNHGVYLQNILTPGSVAATTGTAGAGNMSDDENGNYFDAPLV